MNLSTATTQFLETIDSPRTRSTYATGLRSFAAFLSLKADPPTLSDLDSDVLVSFKVALARDGRGRFTQSTYTAAVRSFLEYALDRDLLPATFSLEKARIRLKHSTKHSAYPIPRADPALPQIVGYYENMPLPAGETAIDRARRLAILRARAFCHILYSTAARLSEISALNRDDVGDGSFKRVMVHGKGDKSRVVFMTIEAQRSITEYLKARNDTYQPLLISHWQNRGQRLSICWLEKIVSEAGDKLGIKGTHPHQFRHYVASSMLNSGARMEEIQAVLGHSDIGTTARIYAHLNLNSIEAAFDRTAPGLATAPQGAI